MTSSRWQEYCDCLDEAGLLTNLAQSRTPVGGQSATLDDLRAGRAGERVEIKASSLYVDLF